MPTGWGQENVISSEIDHAWAVEWMRLAGCSLYTYTVQYVHIVHIWGRFFIAVAFFAYTVYECRNWETEHYNSVLEMAVSFLGIHQWEPQTFILDSHRPFICSVHPIRKPCLRCTS
jgi:hypothetical protein